jgi:hypothetical protein
MGRNGTQEIRRGTQAEGLVAEIVYDDRERRLSFA